MDSGNKRGHRGLPKCRKLKLQRPGTGGQHTTLKGWARAKTAAERPRWQ